MNLCLIFLFFTNYLTAVSRAECAGHCPSDQEFLDCPDGSCYPLDCDEVGYPIPNCGTTSQCPGDPGCVCKDGKVFDDNGNCVKPDQCPSCGGDKNATMGCGTNCGKKCSDLIKKQSICPLICQINGCDCKENYYYDSNKMQCVAAEDCTYKCPGLNEEWDPCPSCAPDTCVSKNVSSNHVHCPTVCKPSCRCIKGYCRNPKGICVKESKCDKCPGPNEEWDPCPSCAPDTCVSKNVSSNHVHCPTVCTASCRCIKGYCRNPKGICVKESKCEICPKNEVYSDCPTATCDPLTCAEAGYKKEKCGSNNPCSSKPGCICKDGFLRDCNGVCIPKDQCPSCGGDVNAIPGCGVCGKTCADIGKNETRYCPMICKNGCDCRKGYVYDQNKKKCVKPEDCTKICPKNEVYSECPTESCRPLTCAEAGYEKQNCGSTNPCQSKPACVCKQGYLRNSKGVCIPSDMCPSCGGDKHAIPGCGNPCGKSCSDIGKNDTIVCPQYCLVNGCDCRKKYVYDYNTKICVKPKDCTPTCKNNEVYDSCANYPCRPQECKDRDKIWGCPATTDGSCCPGCLCKKNYFRKNGFCVPRDQCDDKPC